MHTVSLHRGEYGKGNQRFKTQNDTIKQDAKDERI